MRALSLAVAALSLHATLAGAQPGLPSLVWDPPQVPADGTPDLPSGYAPLAGGLLFAADSPATGRELWWTDGSTAGTRPFADLDPRPGVGSNPYGLTAFADGALCFSQSPGLMYRLWLLAPEGSAQTLASFPLVPNWERPRPLGVAGGRFYFAASDDVHGTELWSSDGTPDGTRLLADLTPGPMGSFVSSALEWRGSLYLQASPGVTNAYPGRLWRVDPDGAVTALCEPTPGFPISLNYGGPMAVLGDRLYFFHVGDDTGESLWSTDGTPRGTRLDVLINDLPDVGLFGKDMAAANGLLFVADGNAPFVIDGSGTPRRFLLPSRCCLYSVTALGDRALLRYSDSLWISDGTDAGTRQLTSQPLSGPTASDGTSAYFVEWADTAQPRLWRVDGPSGTALRLDGPAPDAYLADFPTSWTPRDAFGGFAHGALVAARVEPGRATMLAVDANATSIRTIASLEAVGPETPRLSDLLPVHGGVVFLAAPDPGRTGLWFSDGTSQGTVLLAPYPLNPANLQYYSIWRSGDLVYFVSVGESAWMLHRTDGTAQGTRDVPLVAADGTVLQPLLNLDRSQSDLFIARPAADFSDREWLVLLDHETGEARRIEPLRGAVNSVWDVKEGLHVLYDWGTDSCQYYDDETGTRTPLLMPGSSLVLGRITPAHGRVYFLGLTVLGDTYEYGVWVSDGPGEVARRLVAFPELSQTNFFPAGDRAIIMTGSGDGVDLWTTLPDGSAAPHVGRFAEFDRNNGVEVAGFAGDAYFVPLDLATGREAWRTDGTPEGAALLADTIPGPDGRVTNLRDLGRFLAFTAPTATHGPELWLGDGTPAGTHPLSTLTGTPRTLEGRQAAVSGGMLLLTGSGPGGGEALWAVRLCAPDFSGDGFLDFFDYTGFVEAFEQGDAAADFNADGFLDFFDYTDFVAAFERGC